jgi:ATP-independent RNA helicase DbpA
MTNVTGAFTSLGLQPELLKVIREIGYQTMTQVQKEAIPILLEKRDLICQAETGSGKTMAFAIPMVTCINPAKREIQALVLCPTRELCQQVAREIRKVGRIHAGMQVIVLAGGQPIMPQVGALEKGAHIAVGTPGRILDLLARKALHLGRAAFVVLDEADRMLDMGFKDDVEEILQATPKARQTALFSATYPSTIGELSETYQNTPAHVVIKPDVKDVPKVRKIFHQIDREHKELALRWMLQHYQPESAIIFCNMKQTVADLTASLRKSGLSVLGLHGDLEQFDRDRVMAQFRNQSVRYVLATDVAARGIDVEGLAAAINFDLPQSAEVFVHRIGRTGRAGQEGLALSLITPGETYKIEAIEKLLPGCEQVPLARPEELKSFLKQNWNPHSSKMCTLYFSSGRKDKLRPGDILGALTREGSGIKGEDVGKIEIYERYAYAGIKQHLAPRALRTLTEYGIKGRKINILLLD